MRAIIMPRATLRFRAACLRLLISPPPLITDYARRHAAMLPACRSITPIARRAAYHA